MFKQPYIFFWALLCSFVAHSQDSDDEKQLFKAIRSGDTATVASFLSNGFDINGNYGKDGTKTLLITAINGNEHGMVKFLVRKGADIEQRSKGMTPLMEAASKNNMHITRYLLDRGADVDAVDPNGNTALFHAAKLGTLRLNRLLVQRGSDVSHTNRRKWMAHDMAVASNKDTLVNYLRTMVAKKDTFRTVPDFTDGPHVIWENHSEIFVVYFQRDSATNQTLFVDRMIDMPGDSLTFSGFLFDTTAYTIYRELLPEEDEFGNVDRVFVIGDLHGQYDTLVEILRISGITDQDLNWAYGDGHLVITGDLFDRGDKVTESLWLVYKLEHQARKQGGYVHFILGTHEIMNLTDDMSYHAPKYWFFSRYFDINYSQFLTPSSVLGEWLRSKNTLLRINDILFVHGGISSQVLSLQLSIDSVNQIIRSFLNLVFDKANQENLNVLLFTFGPFWYRGYFKNGHLPAESTQEQINRILEFYNVSYIVVAHTDVPYIVPMFDGKVFPIEIPFHDPEYHQQSLLIEDGSFYRVYLDGRKVLLK